MAKITIKNRFLVFISILISLIFATLITIIYSPLNSLTVEVQSPSVGDTYQLFYDIGEGINESDSSRAFIKRHRDVVKVVFKIPYWKKIRVIRIDPGTKPGTIRINRVTLNSSLTRFYNKELYSWIAEEMASSFSPTNHISEFEVINGSLRIQSDNGDPFFVSNIGFNDIYTDVNLKRIESIKHALRTFLLLLPVLLIIFLCVYKNYTKLESLFEKCLSVMSDSMKYKYVFYLVYPTLLFVLIVNVYIPHIKDYFFLFDDYVLVHAAINNSVETIFTSTNYLGFYRPLITFMMAFESKLWHFNNPHGYILVSITLHILNSVLLIFLTRELKFKIHQCLLAASMFLISPWSSETFFWLSCRFDITATLFILLTLIYSLRALRKPRIYDYSIIFLVSLIAYVSKEISVTLPFTFLLLAIRDQGAHWLKNSSVLKIFSCQILSLVVYFIIRSRFLGVFGGAYGSYFDMVNIYNFIINPLVSLNNYILTPISPNNYASHLLFLFLLFLIAYHALFYHFRLSAFLLLAYLITIAPTLFSIPSGRLIYYPSIYICIIFSVGMVSWFESISEHYSENIAQYVFGILCITIFSYMYGYINFQRKIWSEASLLASESMVQISEQMKYSNKIYISNLPILFTEGQFILKSYAFRFYFQNPQLSVRSDGMVLKYDNGNIHIVGRHEDSFSQHTPEKNELPVTLQFSSLVD